MKISNKKKSDRKPQYCAVFAMRWNFGDAPYPEGQILKNDETWHEAVSGSGGSYRPGGPDTIWKGENESLQDFRNRVTELERNWEN